MLHNLLTHLHNMDEMSFWENRPFSGVVPEPKRGQPVIKKPIKKKIKRSRTAFTTKQLRTLELMFIQNKYITPERRREISKALNLGDKSIKIWFQNRRMKEKRESSESSLVESDSSNETIANREQSPSAVTVGSHSPDQNEIKANTNLTPESCQYEIPDFYANNINEQIQNINASDYNTVQANGMQYYNDSNMHITQYYPYNGGNYLNDYHYCQYQQENSMQNNYWHSNNYAPSYYYNEGV